MGIGVELWRARIGLNSQPNKSVINCRTLKISGRYISFTLRLFLLLALLTCGDIESNPGPPRQQPSNRNTRQTALSFAQSDKSFTSSNGATGNARPAEQNESFNDQEEMFSFLRRMKSKLLGQNEQVRKDLSVMNKKMDLITERIDNLKAENELLKQSNRELKSEIGTLYSKIDFLESQSRRNNLRFIGIDGNKNEDWSVSEAKVRDFVGNELNMPDKREVEIERAHRLRGSGGDRDQNGIIIVKFSKYKDCASILQKARDTLGKESRFSVLPDFTDRVRRHRRELGRRMVEARSEGKYASIRYDKLYVENKVFQYDDSTHSIVSIATRAWRARDPQGQALTNERTDSGTAFDAHSSSGATARDIQNTASTNQNTATDSNA